MAKPLRDSHDILYDMLDCAKDGVVKTRILQRANLSHAQLTKYLELLQKRDLMRRDLVDGKEIWVTTENGLKALEACKVCQLIVREKGIFK